MTDAAKVAALREALDAMERVKACLIREGGRLTPAAILDVQAAINALRATLSASDSGEVAGLREVLEAMERGSGYFGNRYDTDDEMVLSVWMEGGGATYDVRLPRATPPAPTPASEDGLPYTLALTLRRLVHAWDDGLPVTDYVEALRPFAATAERPAEPTGEPS